MVGFPERLQEARSVSWTLQKMDRLQKTLVVFLGYKNYVARILAGYKKGCVAVADLII